MHGARTCACPWEQGRSGISQIEGFECGEYTTRFAGEIKDFDPSGYIDKKNARRMDACIKYTMVAGKKARACGCCHALCTLH
jgi:3-oxoacyl-[acyl-carrier-protein] synthase II